MTFIDVVVSTQGSPEGPGGYTWTGAAQKWASKVGPLARVAITNKAPIGPRRKKTVRKGGTLKRSITDRSFVTGGTATVTVGTPVSYAKYVIDGTRPHLIVPTKKRALSFVTNSGETVTVRSVHHPGTRPNNFVKRAMKPKVPEIRAAFAEIMRDAMGGQ